MSLRFFAAPLQIEGFAPFLFLYCSTDLLLDDSRAASLLINMSVLAQRVYKFLRAGASRPNQRMRLSLQHLFDPPHAVRLKLSQGPLEDSLSLGFDIEPR